MAPLFSAPFWQMLPQPIGDDWQYTALRNGEVIYSETVSRSPDGMSHFTYPKLDPTPDDGLTINFGDWFAPVDTVDTTLGRVLLLLTLPVVLAICWAVIHFLMSISRMIRAANEV